MCLKGDVGRSKCFRFTNSVLLILIVFFILRYMDDAMLSPPIVSSDCLLRLSPPIVSFHCSTKKVHFHVSFLMRVWIVKGLSLICHLNTPELPEGLLKERFIISLDTGIQLFMAYIYIPIYIKKRNKHVLSYL